MSYSELLKAKRLKPGKFSRRQIKDLMALANRDVETAKKVLDVSPDWAFSIAYNGMLQGIRALMFDHGFRPIGEGQHATAIESAKMTLGPRFAGILEFMDELRHKRHKTVYEIAGYVSHKEASEAIKVAEEFVEDVTLVIRAEK